MKEIEENASLTDVTPTSITTQVDDITAPIPMQEGEPTPASMQQQMMPEEMQARIAELEDYRNSSIESNKKILEIFKQNPEIVNIMKMMSEGASFMEAIARNLDIAKITPIEGEPDYSLWKKSNEERVNASKKVEELRMRIDGNISISQQAYKKFIEEKKLSEEDVEKLSTKLEAIINDVNDGLVAEDIIEAVYKSLNFDKIVEAAKEEGALSVKNEKIEAFREDKNKKGGDGLPNISSAVSKETPKKEKSELEEIIEMQNKYKF